MSLERVSGARPSTDNQMARKLGRRDSEALGAVAALAIVAVLLLDPASAGSASSSNSAASCSTGAGNSTIVASDGVAWDPIDHRVYVSNAAAGTISVLKGACTIVATIRLPKGATPEAAIFDPHYGRVFITDFGLNQIYEVSGPKVVATITGKLSGPIAIVYDPDATVLLVADLWTARVTEVSGTNANTTIPTGVDPTGVAFDSHFGTVLVTNAYSDNVTILNATNPTLPPAFRPGTTGSYPYAIIFDPANSFDYIANYYSNNLTVMYGNGTKVGTISVAPDPCALGYSVAQSEVYVSNHGGHSVWAISGLAVFHKFKLGPGTRPLGVGYDSADREMYVSAAGIGEVIVLK